jgi:hypothetical protein
MRLITVLDTVKHDDGRQLGAHYHVLTHMGVTAFIAHYARRMEARTANYSEQGKQRLFAIQSVVEVGSMPLYEIHALQSPNFTGYVLLLDGNEVEFENYQGERGTR